MGKERAGGHRVELGWVHTDGRRRVRGLKFKGLPPTPRIISSNRTTPARNTLVFREASTSLQG